jgi:hypothetical protein
MTAIMVQFLEVKHRSKKIIFPNFLIPIERLDLCYARPLREGQAVDCRFEQHTLKKPKFDRSCEIDQILREEYNLIVSERTIINQSKLIGRQ